MTAPAHAVLMDRIYRHQRYFYDLTRRPYLFGRDILIRDLRAKSGDTILEIGCGTARNLIKTARRYPGTMLWGIDASAVMLHTAERAAKRAGLSNRIKLLHGMAEDAAGLIAQTRFDHVIFSYSLSMIADWRAALLTGHALLSDQGSIHVVDFGDLGGLGRTTASLLRAWLHLFHVCPRHELLLHAETAARNKLDCRLRHLRGRYAFVFQATSSALRDLGL